MEVFFYCSYERSQRGFFMTRVGEDGLVPAEEGGNCPPEAVRDFFSYDRFSFLWRDLCPPTVKLWEAPRCTGGVCGVRNLRGPLADGRSGVVNLAFYAGAEELVPLRRTALSILGDYDAFRDSVLSWISVGGEWGYQLNLPAFHSWLKDCREASRLRKLAPPEAEAIKLLSQLQLDRPPRMERDTLRLAACTSSWETISPSMGAPGAWKRRPRRALDEGEFTAAFTGRGPLWTMERGS